MNGGRFDDGPASASKSFVARHRRGRCSHPHHYLSGELARSAVCFLASWDDRPVAFSAWLPFVGAGPPTRREHRTVTLPDYQGIGIGNALSALIASLWRGLGYRAVSTTTHPAMIRARLRSPLWRLRRAPGLASGRERRLRGLKHATTRLTAGFEYVGPALPRSAGPRLFWRRETRIRPPSRRYSESGQDVKARGFRKLEIPHR